MGKSIYGGTASIIVNRIKKIKHKEGKQPRCLQVLDFTGQPPFFANVTVRKQLDSPVD
jgi:hypothetical protein